MVTIRHERTGDAAAREAAARRLLRAGAVHQDVRALARRPSAGAVAGRRRGPPRRRHGPALAGLGRPEAAGAAARSARGRIPTAASAASARRSCNGRCARRSGTAMAPCCWSATRLTTRASASPARRPVRSGCRGRTNGTGCSASSSSQAHSTAPGGWFAPAASGRRAPISPHSLRAWPATPLPARRARRDP